VDDCVGAGGNFTAAVTVTNTGPVAGADVVQVYGRDVVASVVRPVAQLLGYARVELAAGQSRRVTFEVPTTRLAFSARRYVRIVEPGAVEVWVAAHASASAEDLPSVSTTNGAISNSALSVAAPVPGTATERACLKITGSVYEVSTSDPRLVVVRMDEA
jgi:Fibronectin type III-like domain